MKCQHLHTLRSTRSDGTEIRHCNKFGCSVVSTNARIHVPDGLMRSCIGCPINPDTPKSFETTFDRAVIIHLERRPDRVVDLQQWPFVKPTIQKAIDGNLCPRPEGFLDNSNFTWGCFQSHRQALQDALNDGCESLIVMEDDTVLGPDFAARAKLFFDNLPSDWEIVFLAGRHHNRPTVVKEGVLRASELQYLGCYGLRGEGLKELYRFWSQWHTTHCDIAAQKWFGTRKTYTPHPFLAGHSGGWSDVSLHDKDKSYFQTGPNYINGGIPLNPDPGEQEWERQIVSNASLPCIHRGDRQMAVLCNRGCPSQRSEPVSVYSCGEFGVCTLGNRRSDLHSCLGCSKQAY